MKGLPSTLFNPLESTNHPCFVSQYMNSYVIDPSAIIIGCIMSRPLNVTFKNNISFVCYYCDFLCIEKDKRNRKIAPELIQTHEYYVCHYNKKNKSSLFKREDKVSGLIPFIRYSSNMYEANFFKQLSKLDGEMKLIEISTSNINLLTSLISDCKNLFNSYIMPDLSTLIYLLKTKIYRIYGILKGGELMTAYFFKNTEMLYNINSEESTAYELFASLTVNDNKHIFIIGFIEALNILRKKEEFDNIVIENLSHNYIIYEYATSLGYTPIVSNTFSYFFYNYIQKTIAPDKVLILT